MANWFEIYVTQIESQFCPLKNDYYKNAPYLDSRLTWSANGKVLEIKDKYW